MYSEQVRVHSAMQADSPAGLESIAGLLPGNVSELVRNVDIALRAKAVRSIMMLGTDKTVVLQIAYLLTCTRYMALDRDLAFGTIRDFYMLMRTDAAFAACFAKPFVNAIDSLNSDMCTMEFVLRDDTWLWLRSALYRFLRDVIRSDTCDLIADRIDESTSMLDSLRKTKSENCASIAIGVVSHETESTIPTSSVAANTRIVYTSYLWFIAGFGCALITLLLFLFMYLVATSAPRSLA